MTKNTKIRKKNNFLILVSGLFALILGIGVLSFEKTIMSQIAESLMQLKPNSPIFELWKKFPLEVPTIYRFFNWTNSENFFNKSIKPIFKEIGPYQYLQTLERVGIVWNDNNTITFKQMRTFRYDDEFQNNGNLSDKLITINYVSMSYAHRTRFWDVVTKDIFSEYLLSFDPYYYFKSTVDAEIMKGNDNAIIEIANYFDFLVPEFPRFDHFGWLRMRNGDPQFDGIFNMANGANRKFDVLNWNYFSSTPYFNEACAKVRGSIGDIHSLSENKEFIYIFVPDMCRYIKLYFEEEITIDGILGYKYSLNEISLDNGTIESENNCFCNGKCIPSGLLNLSSCQFGLNGFGSLPHFYNADPVYVNTFEGLNPDKSKHETYIVVEPTTMVLIDFRLRVQVNMFTHTIDNISFFDNFPELYFPLFWIEQQSELPQHLKFYLKLYLKFPIVVFSVGAALLILGICLMLNFFNFYSIIFHKHREILNTSECVSLNQNKHGY